MKDYWYYCQLSGSICLASVAYTFFLAANLPLHVTATVIFVGMVMLSSCLYKQQKAESYYLKAEHKLKEAANEKMIAKEANCEESKKENIDYNQSLDHIPDQKLKHTPSNKLEEVAIENIFQRQIIAR
jgi:hypothetical protein